MNASYFVTAVGGSSVIASVVYDEVMKRERLLFSKREDIRLLFNHRHYLVGFTQKGGEIWKDLGTAWIEHPGAAPTSASRSVPNGDCPPDIFNLWRGFGVTPAPGRWPTIAAHLRDVVCAGDGEHYAWLLGWLASCVQHPERHAGTAVVLRGRKGTGKGRSARSCGASSPATRCRSSTAVTLPGTSTVISWMRSSFVDEALWAGDKAGESVLKGLITEEQLIVEPKGVDAFPMPNRLKVLMASNNDWVVPVSADERRYFVLDVSDAKRGDTPYFNALFAAIEGDELAAMLHDLLARDLTPWNGRSAPHTKALNDQKMIGGDSP